MKDRTPTTTSTMGPMAIRSVWEAATPSHANRAARDLMDQFRGAELTATRPPGFRVCVRVWYSGQLAYGLDLWLEPWAEPPKDFSQHSPE